MSTYWAQFAYEGDPGTGRDNQQPEWLAWGEQGKTSIILDSPADQGIFMDQNIVTTGYIKALLAADYGFPNPEDQCAIYVRNFRGNQFDQSEYAALNDQCADIDPATFAGF